MRYKPTNLLELLQVYKYVYIFKARIQPNVWYLPRCTAQPRYDRYDISEEPDLD